MRTDTCDASGICKNCINWSEKNKMEVNKEQEIVAPCNNPNTAAVFFRMIAGIQGYIGNGLITIGFYTSQDGTCGAFKSRQEKQQGFSVIEGGKK